MSNFTKFILLTICIAQLSATHRPPEKGEKSIIYAFGLTLLYRDCVIKHSRCWGPAPCDVTKALTTTTAPSLSIVTSQLPRFSSLPRHEDISCNKTIALLRGSCRANVLGGKAENKGLNTVLWTSTDALG